MKTVTFTIAPFSESLNRFNETFKAVQAGRHIEPREIVGFTSLEAGRNFLTRERLGLLRTIRSRNRLRQLWQHEFHDWRACQASSRLEHWCADVRRHSRIESVSIEAASARCKSHPKGSTRVCAIP